MTTSEGKLVARWETRGKKYWYELYEESYRGKPVYAYRMDHGCGNLGCMSRAAAIRYLVGQMAGARIIDGINYKRVYPRVYPKPRVKK